MLRRFPRLLFNTAEQFGGGGTPPAAPPAGGTPPAPPAGGTPPAAPPATPPAQPWYGAIQDQGVRDLMASKSFDSPEKVAAAYMHANRALGGAKDVVALPGDGATPQQMDAFYKSIGRPDAPEGYTLKTDPGAKVDEGFLKAASGFFHKAGLSPAQAQAVVDNWQAYIGPRMQQEQAQQQQAIEAAVGKVRTELGANYEAARQKGGAFLNSLGLSGESADWLAQNGGSNAVVELIARVGAKLTGEGGLVQGPGTGGGIGDVSSMTKEQAGTEISRLNGDKAFNEAYLTKTHPGHTEAVQKMNALYARRAAA